MPSIKAIALAATLATTAVAYSTPLEARNDLDFTPEDIDVLFGRDVEIDGEDLELLARDLDLTPEDLEALFARSLFSSALKVGKSAFSAISKHKDGISKTFDAGTNAISTGQQINGQRLQNKQTAIQNQQLSSSGGGGGGGRARKRSLLDDEDEIELIARELDLDAEDVEYLLARAPTSIVSKVTNLGRKHGERVLNGATAGAGLVATAQMIHGQSLQNEQMKQQNAQMQQGGGGMGQVTQRSVFEEEDPDMWF